MVPQKEFWVKNMVCSRCLKVIKQELEELKVTILSLELGRLTIKADPEMDEDLTKLIGEVLSSNGFGIVQSTEEILVEKIKILLIGLLEELPIQLTTRTSEYLSARLHRDYKTLSKRFSKIENTTIEKYFIKLKIEKVKELIQLQQLTFSQIAYMLDYSSVNHLSRQFKNLVGLSMSEYKNADSWDRIAIDEII